MLVYIYDMKKVVLAVSIIIGSVLILFCVVTISIQLLIKTDLPVTFIGVWNYLTLQCDNVTSSISPCDPSYPGA